MMRLGNKMVSGKEMMIYRLSNTIHSHGIFLKEDDLTPPEDKLQEMDVLLNVKKFLDNYDENIKLIKARNKDDNELER